MSYEVLRSVVDAAGIWSGTRAASHAFRLSPSVYTISETQRTELEMLGFALKDCLQGLSHIAVIAFDQSLNYAGGWTTFRRVFSTGVPKIYQQMQRMKIKDIPQLLKLDLMVNQDGQFKIAEIDGHNKHGLGYSTMGKRFRAALYPTAKTLPGAVKLLVGDLQRQGAMQLKLFFADQEKFYIPEFEVAQQEFSAEGMEMLLLPELGSRAELLKDGVFLDLPFLYHRTQVYQELITAYTQGTARFVIPPKPFMGAKGVLALLRNDAQDPEVEVILRSFIKAKSLERVRQYIPETYLVGQQATTAAMVQSLVSQKKFVLKESISSGMKGVYFSDESDFTRALKMASKTNMNWILQEEVVNQPQTFSWYEADGKNAAQLRTAQNWFMRVTVQFVSSQLADVIVTARQDRAVHGAKDCIQLGTVIV